MSTQTIVVRTQARKRSRKLRKPISHLRKPEEMSLEQVQIALRKQIATQQRFRMEDLGAEPIFSEFRVHNPQTKRAYHVAIRGLKPGDNFCSCPDYAVDTLGTCKHIEHVVRKPTPSARPQADALLDLVNAGRNLFDALAQTLSGRAPSGESANAARVARVEQDPRTGEKYLRLALPAPEKLKGILDAIAGLL